MSRKFGEQKFTLRVRLSSSSKAKEGGIPWPVGKAGALSPTPGAWLGQSLSEKFSRRSLVRDPFRVCSLLGTGEAFLSTLSALVSIYPHCSPDNSSLTPQPFSMVWNRI